MSAEAHSASSAGACQRCARCGAHKQPALLARVPIREPCGDGPWGSYRHEGLVSVADERRALVDGVLNDQRQQPARAVAVPSHSLAHAWADRTCRAVTLAWLGRHACGVRKHTGHTGLCIHLNLGHRLKHAWAQPTAAHARLCARGSQHAVNVADVQLLHAHRDTCTRTLFGRPLRQLIANPASSQARAKLVHCPGLTASHYTSCLTAAAPHTLKCGSQQWLRRVRLQPRHNLPRELLWNAFALAQGRLSSW